MEVTEPYRLTKERAAASPHNIITAETKPTSFEVHLQDKPCTYAVVTGIFTHTHIHTHTHTHTLSVT